MKPSIHTFGCKVNSYDSGLLQKGFAEVSDKALERVHIINSCAVTAEATKEALKEAKKLKKKFPDSKVVVTGCSAQVDTQLLSSEDCVDLVVANSHKGQLPNLVSQLLSNNLTDKVFKSNIFKKEDLESGGGLEERHTRSFLKIQDGCNSFCTFCVIPFARGKSRSIGISPLVDRVNELKQQGINEVVITGIHIGDYRDESLEDGGLEALLEQLLLKTTMPRFRVSSLEPVELTSRLMAVYSDRRMCPHFHMSIQSANSTVLKNMKRNYDAVAVERALTQIYKKLPGAFVGMDVIAGFPGETDGEFRDSCERLENLYWTRIHVFPYSPRQGTYATRLPGAHRREAIKERARQLRELSDDRYSRALMAQVGTLKNILVLNKKPLVSLSHEEGFKSQVGLSGDYWQVQFEGPPLPRGSLCQVRVTGAHKEDGQLFGHL